MTDIASLAKNPPEDFVVQSLYLVAIDEELSKAEGLDRALAYFSDPVSFGEAEIYWRTTQVESIDREDPDFSKLVKATLYQVKDIKALKYLSNFLRYVPENRAGSDYIAKNVRLASPDTDAWIYMRNF